MKIRFGMLALVAGLAGEACAIDGVVPPLPGDADYSPLFTSMEAACGWGRTLNLSSEYGNNNNTLCSGTLVAPNIIVAPQHCLADAFEVDRGVLVGPDDERMWAKDAAGNVVLDSNGVPVPVYTARFRLKPDGSVGTLAGGPDSFYQTPVKYILVSPDRDVTLLFLSDGPGDTSDFGLWSGGYLAHIAPIPVFPVATETAARFTAYPAGYGPVPDGSEYGRDRGVLRYLEFEESRMRDTIFSDGPTVQWGGGTVLDLTFGDSGTVTLSVAETGDTIFTDGISIGMLRRLPGMQQTLDLFFNGPQTVLGKPMLHPTSPFDVTEDADPHGAYGKPDWRLNTNDVLALASQNVPGGVADWNGDGLIDHQDLADYATDLTAALNPYHEKPIFPLPARAADVNGDGRFNESDAVELQGLFGSSAPEHLRFDFSGDGTIEADDFGILETVRLMIDTSYAPTHPRRYPFDHGFAGDQNRDGLLDESDVVAIRADLALFEGTDNDQPGYSVLYDAVLDQRLDDRDRDRLAVRLLPGDSVNTQGELVTDLQLSIRDLATFCLNVARSVRGEIGQPSDANYYGAYDTTSADWTIGEPYMQPDGQYTFADGLYAMTVWQTPMAGAFQTGTLLDFWFFDLNEDGRVNYHDMRTLELSLGSADFPGFDLNANGVIDSVDLENFARIVLADSPFGHGLFGDFDGSASPTCMCDLFTEPKVNLLFCEDDIQQFNWCTEPLEDTVADCDDLAAVVGAGPSLFSSGSTLNSPGYVVQLDADLDGDLDLDDRREVFHALQPGDLNFDGIVDLSDVTDFISRFSAAEGSVAGDASYDIGVDMDRNGILDLSDINLFVGYASAPNCP